MLSHWRSTFLAESRKSLAGSLAVYLLANILDSAIPFFRLPVLTRYLPPTEYGGVAIGGGGHNSPVLSTSVSLNSRIFEPVTKFVGQFGLAMISE